jgi:hypothetical protein
VLLARSHPLLAADSAVSPSVVAAAGAGDCTWLIGGNRSRIGHFTDIFRRGFDRNTARRSRSRLAHTRMVSVEFLRSQVGARSSPVWLLAPRRIMLSAQRGGLEMASRAYASNRGGDQLEGSEKREWFRTRTIYRLVTVRARGQQAFGRIRNISDGGLCVECPLVAAPGERLQIYFTNRLFLGGRVVWRASGACGVQFDVPVDCRGLLAEATKRCLESTTEPLTLKVQAPVTFKFERGLVNCTVREMSPLCLRLDSHPELSAGHAGMITLPSGTTGRGVIRDSSSSFLTFLLCTPLSAHDIGCHASISLAHG